MQNSTLIMKRNSGLFNLCRNGSQSLEFSSSGNYSNPLIQQIQILIELMTESIEPVDKSNWKERYYELTEEYLDYKFPNGIMKMN